MSNLNKTHCKERDRAQQYFDIVGVLLIIIDADQKIIRINRKGCEILGYEKEEELIGISYFNTFIPERLRNEVLRVFRLLMGGEVEPAKYFENPVLTKSGEERILAWHNTVLRDKQGKIYAILCSGVDITERRRTEEELKKMYTELKESQSQLIQSEKMNAVGTLVAGVAHELNNPLTAMLHFIQYCIQHTSKDDRLYPVLQDLKHETISCIDTVQNLLTFSHMRREGKIYKKANLDTIINRVLKLLTYRIMKENISITQHSTTGIPDISMNVNNIQQVFLNLISNSMDAVKESKKKKVSIDIHCDGKYVQTIISDSGCGISPENINNIFDPFFTTKPVGKGTGLGLSLCQSIIKAHNGEITCESVPGEGAKFIILLPATTENTEKSRERRDTTTENTETATTENTETATTENTETANTENTETANTENTEKSRGQ
ncbi:PAS domain S-box protein [candidate division WOR-3 bacterium]|nr:PAS domain S-box protein [candidate division WOR-3 bacterium]